MPQARTLPGRFFVTTTSQPKGAPFVDRAITVEKEEPFRRGDGYAIKLGRELAVVVGRWKPRVVPAGIPVGPEQGA